MDEQDKGPTDKYGKTEIDEGLSNKCRSAQQDGEGAEQVKRVQTARQVQAPSLLLHTPTHSLLMSTGDKNPQWSMRTKKYRMAKFEPQGPRTTTISA